MSRKSVCLNVILVLICSALRIWAQQAASAGSVVPSMVKFAGTLSDADGKPLTGTVGVTFLLYKEQTGGAPLWLETQNVQADKTGHYSVMLGSASTHGLPADVFVGGEARWLGVQPQGQAEQPRTMLMSVPYALKAADAETLGGKPLSAFQLVLPQSKSGGTHTTQPTIEQPNEIRCAGGAACKTGFVPLFSTNGGSAKVNDSIISQSGTTVKIAGSQTVNGGIASGGIITATSAASTPTILGTSTGNANGSIGVEGISNSSTSYGVAGSNSSGIGVYGTSVSSHGVFGSTSGTCCFGVVGEGAGGGIYGSGNTGILGFGKSSSSGNAGIYGQSVSPSSWGITLPAAGVWGDTGVPGPSSGFATPGVFGTAGDANAGSFFNNSSNGWYTLFAASFDSSGPMFDAYNESNNTFCYIDASGHMTCSAAHRSVVSLDGGKRKVALSAIESPENWFEDFGSAKLVNGVAVVRLDADFIQTVNAEKNYRVFPVPNGDCKGLYVTNKTPNSFEVHELGGGNSNVSFDYRITAVRKNYETVRFADLTKDSDPAKMLEQMRKGKLGSTSGPAFVKPAAQPAARVPVARLTNN